MKDMKAKTMLLTLGGGIKLKKTPTPCSLNNRRKKNTEKQ